MDKALEIVLVAAMAILLASGIASASRLGSMTKNTQMETDPGVEAIGYVLLWADNTTEVRVFVEDKPETIEVSVEPEIVALGPEMAERVQMVNIPGGEAVLAREVTVKVIGWAPGNYTFRIAAQSSDNEESFSAVQKRLFNFNVHVSGITEQKYQPAEVEDTPINTEIVPTGAVAEMPTSNLLFIGIASAMILITGWVIYRHD